MRTVVISDLHLGARSGKDVLRQAGPRAALCAALQPGDRLVILGDGLELREIAQRDAPAVAAEFFSAVGAALGPDGELLVLAGNHDHGLVADWIDARLRTEPEGFLGLACTIAPAGPLPARLAELAAPARLALAYPGVWLRDDVYAFHGHYLDLHSTVPAVERLVAGAMARWAVRIPLEHATPDDYEAALAPLYGFIDQMIQRADHAAISAGVGTSARVWTALAGERRNRVRAALLGVAYSGAVAAVDAIGLGPLDRDLSAPALRRGGLIGVGEVLRRLGITAPHVLFGHTHRSGPWPADDPAEWITPAGTRLTNTGSWVYQPYFVGSEPRVSPYLPGTAVVLEGDAPPRLMRLLESPL